ncbi:hypothetical protein WOLCODRAFT_26169 [Wolfiporia cocos MD-104 SS10]|uniref:Uncharacterized protein n=1 Tax=Wolfiporia cocos (strain MD-104) TaxID=742152 RepID=A0A2H3JXY6_WOLCO|nr:hypothetical protein WOLCODRAFT_26169 [Wolfiporia cocos MD-104 SS10]
MADVIMGEDRMSRTHVSDNVSPNKRGASTAEELQWSTTPAGSGNVPGGNQGTTIEEHVYRPNKRLRPWPPTDATPEEWKPRTRYPYVRRKKRAEKWWEERDQRYVDDLNIDIEAWAKAHASGGSSAQTTEDVYPRDGEANHRAAIEESRRKLAELERDRPLWEEAARRRQAEEEAARRAREQAERRAEAEEQRKRQEAAKGEEERRARAAKEKAAREEVQRRRQEQKRRWSSGLWTPQRALERYKQLCDEFDQAKYTEADPITFDIVPWPVLNSPVTLTVEDVDWAAVENFFQTVRRTMRGQDYKLFVEKSHRRFHPDRWRARGLLRSVQDEETRNCLEVAANTVTQAITPLWMEAKNL